MLSLSRATQFCVSWFQPPFRSDLARFVGLLLATKLLPQGREDALRRVLHAVGWSFLQRLLLPLVRARHPMALYEDASII